MSVCILEPILLFTANMWTSKTGLLSMMGREWGGWGGDGMYLCPRTVDSIHSYQRPIQHDRNQGREVKCRYV